MRQLYKCIICTNKNLVSPGTRLALRLKFLIELLEPSLRVNVAIHSSEQCFVEKAMSSKMKPLITRRHSTKLGPISSEFDRKNLLL